MNIKMVAEIAYNISLLLALCSLFVIFPYNPLKNSILKKVTTGLIVGIIGIGVMLNPFTLLEGLVFDARSIILVVSGMFFGLVPTIIGAISLIVFRIFEGGVGIVPGITVISFSVIIGLSWRYFRFNKVISKKKQRVIEFYIIGVVTHIAMLAAMLTLPWETAVLTLRNISIPVLVIYPVGTLLISLFLSFQIDMFDFNRRLAESENKYRAMFDSTQVGICNTALDGRVLNANQRFYEIIGYTQEELKTMTFADFTHPDDIEKSKGYLLKLMNDKNAVIFDEKRYVHKDGSMVNVLLSAVMLWKNDIEPLYTVTTIMDITKMVQLEQNYSTLIKSLMNGLSILTENGDFVEANEHFCSLIGFTSEELKEMNIGDIAILQNEAGIKSKLLGVSKTGSDRFIDVYRKKDGTELSVEVNLVPMPNSKNKFYMLVRDLTKENRLEDEKKHIEAHLRNQQKLESIGTLASGVAHEINNPINGIMNYAQLILDNHQDDGETAGYAAEIIEESNRVAGIVRSLLQFSRQTEQNYSPIDIREIVYDTMSLIKTTILKDNIEVTYDLGEDLPNVICRKQEIRQVLMNLITNARDAVALIDGEKKITIVSDVEYSGKNRYLRLIIRDNGPGIADNIADKIFDPFFTTKSRDKGTGLGLSISYGIVSEHGGQLKFNSRPEGGTEFILELPCE